MLNIALNMNIKAVLCLGLVLLGFVQAAPLKDIQWGDSPTVVKRQADKSAQLEERRDPTSASQHQLVAKHAAQIWDVYFQFGNNKRELEAILFLGNEGFPVALWGEDLRAYYLFVVNAIKKHYGLGNDSHNTPRFGTLKELSSTTFYPLHTYHHGDSLITIGMYLDKKTQLVHACFKLEPYVDTPMGVRGATDQNNAGTEEEWQNIPIWENKPAAQEFLVRVGLKVPSDTQSPQVAGAAQNGPQAQDEEKQLRAQIKEQELAAINKELPEIDQQYLQALIEFKALEDRQACQTLTKAALAGSARAVYLYAICLEEGRGFIADQKKAETAYLKAAQLGYPLALNRLDDSMEVALSKVGHPPFSDTQMIANIKKEAKAQSVSARMSLALLYRYGYGVIKDVERARAILQELVDDGDIEAKAMLEREF